MGNFFKTPLLNYSDSLVGGGRWIRSCLRRGWKRGLRGGSCRGGLRIFDRGLLGRGRLDTGTGVMFQGTSYERACQIYCECEAKWSRVHPLFPFIAFITPGKFEDITLSQVEI